MKWQVQIRVNGRWTDDGAAYDSAFEAEKVVGEMVEEGAERFQDVRIVAVAAIIKAPASDEWEPELSRFNGVTPGVDFPATM
jgi:hypothetical protein